MRVFRPASWTIIALALAAPSLAAVSILGSGTARACFDAADFGRNVSAGLEVCSRALDEPALLPRDRAATYVNRGILHMRGKNVDKAVKDFDTALRLEPELAEAYVNKGIAFVHSKREKDAIPLLTMGLTLQPARPEVAYYTRGVAHELVGDAQSAYNDYQAALALKPDWNEPKEQLSRFSVVRSKGA